MVEAAGDGCRPQLISLPLHLATMLTACRLNAFVDLDDGRLNQAHGLFPVAFLVGLRGLQFGKRRLQCRKSAAHVRLIRACYRYASHGADEWQQRNSAKLPTRNACLWHGYLPPVV
jgi:hypothetical protein